MKSSSVARTPATKLRNTGLRPSKSSARTVSSSAKTIEPSVAPRRLMWMWQELPSRSSYFAMNVSAFSCRPASSLAPALKTTWLSAVRSTSSYLNVSSCWPGAHSPFDDSTVMPALYIALRMSRSSGSTSVVPRIE